MSTSNLFDQAAGLRRIVNPQPVRVIAVASGKGGVGKTNVSVNLGISMAAAGKNVLLMDADLSLANIDVLLGLQPKFNLSHVISGEKDLSDVIVPGPGGLNIVPASSGIMAMSQLTEAEHVGLIRAFSELDQQVDVMLIDTSAGITDSVVSFSRAAQEVIVVVCDEPASITDAYALIKLLNKEFGVQRYRIVANMAHSMREGRVLYQKILKVTDRYLDCTLDFMGCVPYDESIRKAVQQQRAVVDAFPRSKAATSFKALAQKADNWPVPRTSGGHLEFFVERLIQASQTTMVTPI